MPTKVVVIVSGGNVQDCYAENVEVEIEVIDFDNIADQGRDAVCHAEERVVELTASMSHIY